ncbi:E3 ubiquitin ligase [Hamiltosporidium tvaerminnensis]|uniref:RING-type E3 ubiquitin transferase n=1 Tax=Hamiltosporidium tvaerminnensis TaxID=1176355 RepID=A0A4Q9L7J1_9MICR|nr:E3 ubiquitin ligase [Hamiltosporidium tvaerminnensis]
MKTLILYGVLHFLLLSFFTYREFKCTKSFYGTLLATTNNNGLHLLHILFLIFIIYFSTKILLSFTLGSLRSEEITALNDNTFLFLTDTLLILTVFTEDLNIKNLLIFTLLLSLKCLTWIFYERISHQRGLKVFILGLSIILFSSLFFIGSFLSALNHPSMHILFSFEFGIVLITGIRNVSNLIIEEKYQDDKKTVYLFYSDIIYTAFKLISYILFFIFTSLFFRIPFNIFRESISTLRALNSKINNFNNYKRISKELDRCEDVFTDSACPICREDIEKGKIVPCGHIFHASCLKRWVERQQVCPICRQNLFQNEVIFSTENEIMTGIPVVYDE